MGLKRFAIIAVAGALALTACGSDDGTGAKTGPTITVGGFDFTESSTLAEIYFQALQSKGYPVAKKLQVGSREIVEPALRTGDIDLVPEYLATLLEFENKGAGEATADVQATLTKLRERLPATVVALEPAPGQNRNEIVVVKATADEHSLTKISDLAAIDDTLVFGGPPECPQRPLCLQGLQGTYGLSFERFRPLDVGGPLTVAALEGGEVDVALLFTTNGAIAEKGFVILEDDKGLQGAENVLPVVRKEIVDAFGTELTALLDSISAKLTNAALQELNKATDIDKKDSDDVAGQWLRDNGLFG